MQYNLDQARLFFRDSLPATKPTNFITKRDLMILDSGKWYVWDNRWVEVNNPNQSQSGTPATVNVGTVTTKTVSPTNQAKVTITDADPSASGATLNFDFEIPQGQQGVPGTGGTGGSSMFINVIGSGADDTAQLQAAIDLNRSTGRPIWLFGTIRVSAPITIHKDSYRLTIYGYGAKIITTTSTAFSVFKRTMPADVAESMQYVNARFMFFGVEMEGSQSQVALDMGASYMARYQDCKFSGFKTANHLRFALRTTIDNCEAVSCKNGFIVDIGNWTGASYTSSNAQSNQTTVTNSRVVYSIPNDSGDVGIGVYGCSGVVVENTIIEGAKYKKSIDKDFKMCPNDKDFTIRNVHSETVYGAGNSGSGEAYYYIRLVGMCKIEGNYSQYKGCLIDASGSPGEVTIDLSGVTWTVKDDAGKLFHNGGGVKWVFGVSSYQSNISGNIPSLFSGQVPSQHTGNWNNQPPNTYYFI